MTMLKKKLLTDRSGKLQDAYIEQAARSLQEEIDAEIMRGMLKECGWTEVVISWIMTHEVSREVDMWVEKHAKGKFWNRGLVWLFKDEKDANWFALRWAA